MITLSLGILSINIVSLSPLRQISQCEQMIQEIIGVLLVFYLHFVIFTPVIQHWLR